jgi:hypothetical protein
VPLCSTAGKQTVGRINFKGSMLPSPFWAIFTTFLHIFCLFVSFTTFLQKSIGDCTGGMV